MREPIDLCFIWCMHSLLGAPKWFLVLNLSALSRVFDPTHGIFLDAFNNEARHHQNLRAGRRKPCHVFHLDANFESRTSQASCLVKYILSNTLPKTLRTLIFRSVDAIECCVHVTNYIFDEAEGMHTAVPPIVLASRITLRPSLPPPPHQQQTHTHTQPELGLSVAFSA